MIGDTEKEQRHTVVKYLLAFTLIYISFKEARKLRLKKYSYGKEQNIVDKFPTTALMSGKSVKISIQGVALLGMNVTFRSKVHQDRARAVDEVVSQPAHYRHGVLQKAGGT